MSISNRMRDVLIEHIDGPVKIIRATAAGIEAKKAALHRQTAEALIDRGFLRVDDPAKPRPRYTIITEEGREELCAALADWADALNAARAAGRRSDRPIPRISRARLRALLFSGGPGPDHSF